MPKILKKSIASLLIAVLLFSSFIIYFPKSTRAQGLEEIFGTGPWHFQSLSQFYVKVHDKDNPDEVFGERYTNAQVDWIIWSVLMWLPSRITGTGFWNCIFTGELKTCWDALTSDSGQADRLALMQENTEPKQKKKLHELVFEERSFSGITYVKNILRNASLIPQANAQGFGYDQALAPVQSMWQGVRDVAYVFFVLVTIIMAFMIMFRVKIAPQIVITVQSALPKIAVAIILVTFSYAIAGLLIDLMYVVFGIVSIIGKSLYKEAYSTTEIFEFITSGPTYGSGGTRISLGIIGASFIYLIIFVFTAISIFFLGILEIMSTALTAIFGVAMAAAAFPFGIMIVIVLLLVLLFLVVLVIIVSLKTTVMLFKTYVGLLLLTIFAPFQIVLGILVPSMGMGAWLKSYVSKLAVFVTAGTMLLMSFYFLTQAFYIAFQSSFGEGIAKTILKVLFDKEISPLGLGATEGWPPLLRFGPVTDSGFPTAFIFMGVSLVIFTLIPKVDTMIKSIIEKRPFAYGTAIGQAFGAAAAPVTYPVREGAGLITDAQKGAYKARVARRAEHAVDAERDPKKKP